MGHAKADQASHAFALAREHLDLEIHLHAREETHLKKIDRVLDSLAQTSPAIKKQVLETCVVCIGVDGVASLKEAELLRAIADALDCPVPPFLPGQAIRKD